ncbi:MAG: hypothetical protein NTU85_00505 [Candidatus Kaiserbacteria bacterium]|nr:hypothetical protein [Candidatus Kaiserbacteria bacterium]
MGKVHESQTPVSNSALDVPRDGTLVTLSEYRRVTGDWESTEKEVTVRLRYLESLCRNIIVAELS